MSRVALLLAGVLAAAGCGGEEPEPRTAGTTATEHPGLKVWVAQGCGSCHRLAAAGSTAEVGPSLDAVLPGRDADVIADKIANPISGSMMPEDFAQRMSASELADLADFLARNAGR